jgi:hypothetical protein
MKAIDIHLLREGDTVVVLGKKKQVDERSLNDTIKVGGKCRYYSEIQTVEDYKSRDKHNDYKIYNFLNKLP